MPQGTFYNIFDEHILEDLEWAVPAHGGFDQLDPNSIQALRQIMDNAAAHPQGSPDSMRPMREAFHFNYVADNIYSGLTPEELVKNAGSQSQWLEMQWMRSSAMTSCVGKNETMILVRTANYCGHCPAGCFCRSLSSEGI